jgi:hypothetical protein
MQKKSKKFKMSFNGQPNMFFDMFISFTCDLHLKLNILNLVNIFFYQMVLKMSPLLCNLFVQTFKTLKFLNGLVFHKFIQWTCIFIEEGMFLLYKKIEISCMILCFPFDYLKNIYIEHLISLVYRTQKDINIVSKLFLNIFINLRRHHFT